MSQGIMSSLEDFVVLDDLVEAIAETDGREGSSDELLKRAHRKEEENFIVQCLYVRKPSMC